MKAQTKKRKKEKRPIHGCFIDYTKMSSEHRYCVWVSLDLHISMSVKSLPVLTSAANCGVGQVIRGTPEDASWTGWSSAVWHRKGPYNVWVEAGRNLKSNLTDRIRTHPIHIVGNNRAIMPHQTVLYKFLFSFVISAHCSFKLASWRKLVWKKTSH